MKKLFLVTLLFFILFFFSHCLKKIKLSYTIRFSFPLNSKKSYIKIKKVSDYHYQIPSEYKIVNKKLYIVDKITNKLFVFDKKNNLITVISNKLKKTITLQFVGSNKKLLPLPLNNRLYTFNEIGKMFVKEPYIYIENIILREENDNNIYSYSLILKYSNNGKPLQIIGNWITKSNKIYPFYNLEKFTVDISNNIFTYQKIDDFWRVLKISPHRKTLYKFYSTDFFKRNNLLPTKKGKIIIENIDNSEKGDFLIVALAYFKKEIEFQKLIFYKVDLQNKDTKLFTLYNANDNFINIDKQNKITIWETKKVKKNFEYINLKKFNIYGHLINSFYIKLNRSKTYWFDIKVQKDGKITGINIENNKFNIVEWR